MIRVSVEFQVVGTTGDGAVTAFQVGVSSGILTADVAVSPNGHVFILIVLQFRIEFMLGGHVVGFELDMVVIAHDGESAFKQRVYAVSGDDDASPADMGGNAVLVDEVGFSHKDLVVLPLHLFGMSKVAILVEEFDVRVLVEDVVVGF